MQSILERRAPLLAALVAVVALTTAGGALAKGGLSIATAPKIAPGVLVSENSSHEPTAYGGDAVGQGCFIDVEYWRLPLTAGDQVEIRSGGPTVGRGFLIALFAPTVTDKTIATATSVAHGYTAMRAVKFTAKSTGLYPVVAGPNCYDGTDGEYGFIVSVKHKK